MATKLARPFKHPSATTYWSYKSLASEGSCSYGFAGALETTTLDGHLKPDEPGFHTYFLLEVEVFLPGLEALAGDLDCLIVSY